MSVPARTGGAKRSRGALPLVLVVFALGFAAGVYTTRTALNGPGYMRRMLGLPVGETLPDQSASAAPPAVQNPVTPAQVSPPAAPPGGSSTSGAGAPTTLSPSPSATPSSDAAQKDHVVAGGAPVGEPNIGAPETTPASPPHAAPPAVHPQPTPAFPAGLDKQVQMYNALLRQVQDAAHNYHAQASGDQANSTPGTLADQQNASIEEITARAKSAHHLFDLIAANPQYSKKYVEKEPALAPELTPVQVNDLGIDHLKFIRAR